MPFDFNMRLILTISSHHPEARETVSKMNRPVMILRMNLRPPELLAHLDPACQRSA